MLNLRGSQSAAQTIVLRGEGKRAKSRNGLVGLFSLVLCALGLFSLPGTAFAHLQCVPYAREQSGIDIHGDARTWWKQAGGIYARGDVPKVGAVMAMAPSSAMPLGHVAVVAKVVDNRHVLLNHANWSRPGMIETGVMAEDVSDAGDWSEVRVWYAPTASLGTRANPVYGFIYPEAPEAQPTDLANTPIQIAAADTGKVNM
ncbi:CHAP domain-containing protein [Novosphingobium sp. 1949]|uniref:CHAP domain-containing protein n=1 Tax=Novosphingobium organovorum TaxID=2930092 RepID=A0ABT0BAT4_9SPHN|nr:CHAP domain-containing protein [Novosphingobium organovorum]MCJ2181995.1 CHAP domain-containing protein [Novosphingobium organovorum]